MIAGGRKERVTFMRKEKSRTSSGSIKESYIPYKTLSAEISYKTSTEREIVSQTTALNVVKLKLRYRRDIDETMFVKLFDEMYNIRYIEHNKRVDTFITAERGKQ